MPWRPPPKLTISQWADRYRVLSPEAAAEHGRWNTSRAEFMRGIMDACSDPTVEEVVFMKSSQVGATELLLNVIGYHIDYDPAPMMVLQPTEKPMAEAFSKDRLAPMLRDCPTLKGRVSDAKSRRRGRRSRDGNNTKLHKKFPGGHLTLVGANAPSGLASRPIRIILFDEVDRYPLSAGSEGDPVKLATKRATTFWNRKTVLVSTPAVKGLSRIEKAYEQTDKRVFEVPCPHCGRHHVLRWGNVVWHDKTPAAGDPEKAVLECPNCHGYITNAQKNAAVRKGRWVATAPFSRRAGFWINEIYSPWTTLGRMAVNFLEAKKDPALLQVFVNTSLGESFDGDGKIVSDEELAKRAENYPAAVPERALVLTAGIDTQPDRLEVEVVGWGAGEESWHIDHAVFHGDPDIPEGQAGSPWTALSDYLKKPFAHAWGIELPISATCIDSGGANTQAVYNYCKLRRGERVFAVKGRGGEGIPVVGTLSRKRTGKVKRPVDVVIVGVDQAKDTIYRRFAIEEPGPGYCHFPARRPAEWYRQLTAEKRVVKHRRGFARREWVKMEGRRNEALDCRVYAYAALALVAPQFDKVAFRLRRDRDALLSRIAAKIAEKVKAVMPEKTDGVDFIDESKTAQDEKPADGHNDGKAATSKPRKRRRRGGFVNSW